MHSKPETEKKACYAGSTWNIIFIPPLGYSQKTPHIHTNTKEVK